MKASSDRQQVRPGFGLGLASFFSALNRVLLCMVLAGVGIPVAVADSQVVEGTRYADQIDESASGVPVEIYAKGGADDIHGSQFSDLNEPGTGNDEVFAGGGDDVLVFSGASHGVDVVAAGEGYDRIVGGNCEHR